MIYLDEKQKVIAIVVGLVLVIGLGFVFYSNSGPIPSKVYRMAQDMVFEVVVKKPTEDKIVYDKELDLSIIPFYDRNDEYKSIGTAFAISKTELISAFHCFHFGSPVYDTYFIRDSKGSVYEIDQITGGSNEKDFIIFTVKDKTFKKYFKFKKKYKAGTPVISIGNAFGEGIIVRDGLILGTIPEEDSGRWDWLKSSADINRGNSGGPLITSNGKVVGLIIRIKGNISLSVPAEVILDSDRSVLHYRERNYMSHNLIKNWLRLDFETQIPLPNSFAEVRQLLTEDYNKFYDSAMTALFEQAPEYDSSKLNNTHSQRFFLQVSFIDIETNEWTISGYSGSYYSPENGGWMRHYSEYPDGFNYYRIRKPDTVSSEEANTNPKYIMDTILQTIRTNRSIKYNLYDSVEYRILSYGEPDSTGSFEDALGRKWLTAYWIIDYEDKVLIMNILPHPNGPTVVTIKRDNDTLNLFERYMRKTCDHIFTEYDESFEY